MSMFYDINSNILKLWDTEYRFQAEGQQNFEKNPRSYSKHCLKIIVDQNLQSHTH